MRSRLFATLALGALAARAASPQLQVVLADDDKRPSLSDLLVIERSVSAFASYFRESKSLSGRLANPLTGQTTLFAPRDAAIMALHRKPHEGPEPHDTLEISMAESEKRNAAYLEQWTAGHVVPDSVDFSKLPLTDLKTMADERTLRIEADGKAADEAWPNVRIQPGGASIVGRREAKDGVLYILDGVID